MMDGTAVGQLQAWGWGSGAVNRVPGGLKPGPPTPPLSWQLSLASSGPIFTLCRQTGFSHISLPSARPLSSWLGCQL